MIYAYLKTHVTNSAFFVANINVYIRYQNHSSLYCSFFIGGGGDGACLTYIKIDFLNECIGSSFLIEYHRIFIRQCMILYILQPMHRYIMSTHGCMLNAYTCMNTFCF